MRRYLAACASADMLMVSYTKSGRTWLRVMVSHVYHRRYGIRETELINDDNFKTLDGRVPAIHFARDTRFPPAEVGPPRWTPPPDLKVAFLVRDPRDTVVSFYYHVTRRAGSEELDRKGIPPAALGLDLDRFVTDREFGVHRVVRYLNRWAEEMAEMPRHLVLRYEDLRSAADLELARLFDLLGEEVTHEEIEQAVAFGAFASMRDKERSGFFNSSRLGATDLADPQSVKVREGLVGGYRRALRPETADEIDRIVDATLNPIYGYRADQR